MLDLYNTLADEIQPIGSAVLTLMVGAGILLYNNKWKKFFFKKADFWKAFGGVFPAIFIFFLMPEIKYQQCWKAMVCFSTVMYIGLKVYEKEHIVFPGNIILSHYYKSPEFRKKKIFSFLRRFLTPYEKARMELEEIKSFYMEQPYEAYCRLMKMDMSQCKIQDQNEYYLLQAASFLMMGAYSEAEAALENVKDSAGDNATVHSVKCVLYERRGEISKAYDEAKNAYLEMRTGKSGLDQNGAQIYNNYACFLIRQGQINKGMDIAKDAAEIALQEKKESFLHFTMMNYFKLLAMYEPDDKRIEEYLKKYEAAIPGDCNRCMPYINVKLQLLRMGRKCNISQNYLEEIHSLNMQRFKDEAKCFFHMSCMNVAFAYGMDLNAYFAIAVQLMREECKELEMIKRVRFYDGLAIIAEFYAEQIEQGLINSTKGLKEFVDLYKKYINESKEAEVRQALEATDSIWVNQKCELRWNLIGIEKQKNPMEFDKVYGLYQELYKEWESEKSVFDMLTINQNIIDECIRHVENQFVPAQMMRSTKKKILLERLQMQEELLKKIDYGVVTAEHAIDIARGYSFAGEEEKMREYMKIFEDSGIPVSSLPEWLRERYGVMKSFK